MVLLSFAETVLRFRLRVYVRAFRIYGSAPRAWDVGCRLRAHGFGFRIFGA